MRRALAALSLAIAACAPPNIAAYHAASKLTAPVSAFERVAIVTSCSFGADTDALRALVGSVHRVRPGRGHVPHVWVVHSGNVPADVREETSWWTRVRLVQSDSTLQSDIDAALERAAQRHACAIYVPLGLELDANGLDGAEWTASNAWLAGNHRMAVLAVESFLGQYAARRLAIEQLAEQTAIFGCVKDSQTSVKACRAGQCSKADCEKRQLPFKPTSSRHGRCSKDVVPDRLSSIMVAHRATFTHSGRPFIAVGVPCTSHGLQNQREHPLVGMLSRSLAQSVQSAGQSHDLRLYVAYDRGDALFDSDDRRAAVTEQLARIAANAQPLYASVVFMEAPRVQRVAALWDALYVQAVADGAAFFLQINDDVRIAAPDLPHRLAEMLPRDSLPAVTAPADANHAWGCALFTQALVGREHAAVFRSLYPPELRDWTTDRWLTEVYRALGRARCDASLVLANGGVPRRYSACDMPSWPLYVLDAILTLEEHTSGELAFPWPKQH